MPFFCGGVFCASEFPWETLQDKRKSLPSSCRRLAVIMSKFQLAQRTGSNRPNLFHSGMKKAASGACHVPINMQWARSSQASSNVVCREADGIPARSGLHYTQASLRRGSPARPSAHRGGQPREAGSLARLAVPREAALTKANAAFPGLHDELHPNG